MPRSLSLLASVASVLVIISTATAADTQPATQPQKLKITWSLDPQLVKALPPRAKVCALISRTDLPVPPRISLSGYYYNPVAGEGYTEATAPPWLKPGLALSDLDDGRYSLDLVITPDTLPAAHYALPAPLTFQVRAGQFDPLALTAKFDATRIGSLAATVLDRAGKPLPKAHLMLHSSYSGMPLDATADDRGRRDFGQLLAGEYILSVQSPSLPYIRRPLHIRPEPTQVTVDYSTLITLQGRVRTAAGNPTAAEGHIHARLNSEARATLTAKADGRFSADLMPDDFPLLCVLTDGTSVASTLLAAPPKAPVELKLPDAPALSLRLVADKGLLAPNRFDALWLCPPGTIAPAGIFPLKKKHLTTNTDTLLEGTLAIAPGTYDVLAIVRIGAIPRVVPCGQATLKDGATPTITLRTTDLLHATDLPALQKPPATNPAQDDRPNPR